MTTLPWCSVTHASGGVQRAKKASVEPVRFASNPKRRLVDHVVRLIGACADQNGSYL
jgi:hypothetical protein